MRLRPLNRVSRLALGCFVAAGLFAYAATYRGTHPIAPYTMFTFNQQTFSATHTLSAPRVLHSIRFKTNGRSVAVAWYDSDLVSLAPKSGIYATLLVDGQPIVNALTGSYFGSDIRGPATLRWAGWLPMGTHLFQLEVSRVDAGANAPYVRPGGIGVDNFVISQDPGGA